MKGPVVYSVASASIGNHDDYESKGLGRVGNLEPGTQPHPTLHHLILFPSTQASRAICKHLPLCQNAQRDGQCTLFVWSYGTWLYVLHILKIIFYEQLN